MGTSTHTTRQLEAYARARGQSWAIVSADGNSAGQYFVVNVEGKPLTRWWTLGWTKAEAQEMIDQIILEKSGALDY